jgi:serine/threonine protein kinase
LEGSYDERVDIYSFGVVLNMLLTHCPEGSRMLELVTLGHRCEQEIPDKRPSWEEINMISSEWLQNLSNFQFNKEKTIRRFPTREMFNERNDVIKKRKFPTRSEVMIIQIRRFPINVKLCDD